MTKTACSKCHKPPFSPCMYNHVVNPGPKICACKCHQAKAVQLVDLSIAENDQIRSDLKIKPGGYESELLDISIVKDRTADVIKIKPVGDVSFAEVAEGVQQYDDSKTKPRCECQWLPWISKCYGHCLKAEEKSEPVKMVDVPIAKVDETAGDIKIKPLGDVSVAEAAEGVQQNDDNNTKSAEQIFMEEKLVKTKAKKKMLAKLALLEAEVMLGERLLLQAKTLRESKEALLLKKVRVKYNKCHKFWRGTVISAHKSFVDKQVDAAKARLGLKKGSKQFIISSMVDTIDKLAPGGCYKSAKPSASPTSTSRPGVRPTLAPRRTGSSRFIVPPPPMPYSVPAKKSSPSPAAVPQTSAGRGDHCIVAYGDALAGEQCCDISTQLEPDADEYLWDGEYDFSIYEDEVEVDVSSPDFICEDSGYDAAEVETCFDAEVEICFDAEEVCYYDNEVEDCDYSAVDYFEL